MVSTGLRPLEVGLVLDLKFNEYAGLVLHDYSDERNHGTITGATWSAGNGGGALTFNGVGDEVVNNAPTNLPGGANDEFTIFIELYFTILPINGDLMGGFGLNFGVNGGARYIIRWNDKVYFWGKGFDVQADEDFDVGSWHTITVVATATRLKIYKNNVEIADEVRPAYILTGQYYAIAKDLAGFTDWMDGKADRFCIWDRALSVEELALINTQRRRM